MKKNWLMLTFSMVFVLALSIVGTKFLLPLINLHTYSQTTCLTDQITDSMDVYDIAKLYRDNHATVAVTVQGYKAFDKYTSLGSGVCVASNGYETSSLENNLTASMGSYVVTNYHVIEMVYLNEFTSTTIKLITEEELEYPCELLWSNRNLDVAILYCEENLDYVEMRDRIVAPAENEKLDYEPIFTIGTPLDLSYLNRLTRGEIASNNLMVMPNAEYIKPANSTTSILALYNTYEDIVDITAGITNGNSGGGCFDEKGRLIGLTTLGLNIEDTGGNQMNAIVPIYPVIEVLDKLISNKEKSTAFKIYTLENVGILGLDSYEAYYVRAFQNQSTYPYYYYEGNYYSVSTYEDVFNFNQEGYYILSNTATSNLGKIPNGSVITSCQINSQNKIEIVDRNDLIYALLQIDEGDSVVFTYTGAFGLPVNQTVQF